MELRQLEHFLAVAEEQHFTRAARRLNIVQSGLSTSVRTLEEELGVDLFLRSTRRVDLTVAGRVLLPEAQRVLAAVRKAKEAVLAVQGLQRGRLSIGMAQTLSPFVDLPALLSQFHDIYPGIEIRLCQGAAPTLCGKVRDGRLDVAFVPVYGVEPEGVNSRLYVCEPLVVACAPSHSLSGQQNLALADLGGATFVDFQPEWGNRQLVDHAFAEANVDRHVAFEVNDMRTLLDLVSFGLGIALVPERIVQAAGSLSNAPGSVAFARLAPPEICWEMVVVFAGRDEPVSAAAGAFLTLLPPAQRTD
ncbi:LysR family transcriptional regulator [Telmatospirillum sp.]|uniref:LysR family transcriptional regulator n=1 Tax=Telmatospirillum sp. TaxID=2079197 RepID=UPI002845BF70|nr:LysR family transcriptional regulator [Telmatospirillum sp.]MDR3435341.1 LysR family transcriptional regulator [Telmatospirillum sp.]